MNSLAEILTNDTVMFVMGSIGVVLGIQSAYFARKTGKIEWMLASALELSTGSFFIAISLVGLLK